MLIINNPKAPCFFPPQFVVQTEAGIFCSKQCLSMPGSQETRKFRSHSMYCISGRRHLNKTKIYTQMERSAWIHQNGSLHSERCLCASILSTQRTKRNLSLFKNFTLLGSREQLREKKY